MKGKFGIAVLLLSSTAFADPVSAPEQPTVDKGVDPMVIQFGGPVSIPSALSDTPIILVSSSCTYVPPPPPPPPSPSVPPPSVGDSDYYGGGGYGSITGWCYMGICL